MLGYSGQACGVFLTLKGNPGPKRDPFDVKVIVKEVIRLV
jgi:hypothetical protein